MLVGLHTADHQGGASPVQERYHASGAAVDVCSDAPVWVQWVSARRDGGGVDVSRALAGSPRAPRMHTQRMARSDPSHVHNC
jgi:hypothetical protein